MTYYHKPIDLLDLLGVQRIKYKISEGKFADF